MWANGKGGAYTRKAKRQMKVAMRKYGLSASERVDCVRFGWVSVGEGGHAGFKDDRGGGWGNIDGGVEGVRKNHEGCKHRALVKLI